MSATTEYIIRLKDQFSVQVKNAQKQADILNNKVNKSNSAFSGLGATLARIGAVTAVGFAVKEVASLGIEMEQTRIAFATFLGDGEKANKLIAQLNEFANVTPFNNAEIIKSGRLLLAAGIPAEQITDQLKQIGDVAAGANVPITELAAIFQKATNKGKLQAEELNQFSERGIPLLDQLSKQFGITKAEVLKMGEQGKITSGVMNEAFRQMTSEGGIFFNLMEKQSQTVGGRISTLIGKLQTIGIVIGEAILPALGMFVDFGLAIIQGSEALTTLGIVIGIIGGALLTYVSIMDVVNALVDLNTWYNGLSTAAIILNTLVTEGLSAAWLALNMVMAANPIGLIIAGIALLVAAFVLAWRHSETFRGAVLGLWEVLKTVASNLWGMIIEPFLALSDIFSAIWNMDFDALIDAFKRWGSSILSFVLQPFLLVAKAIDAIAGTNLAEKLQGFTGIADQTKGVGEAFGKGFAEGADPKKTANGLISEDNKTSSLASGLTPTTGTGNLKAGISEVKAGAPKTFNINIEKLVEGLNINTTNLMDSANKIKEEVQKALLIAVTDATIISE